MTTRWPARVAEYGSSVAIVDPGGTWTYERLGADAARLASALLSGRADLAEQRVALLCRPGHDYVVAMLATWAAGGLAVPLHPDHPDHAYYLDDAEVSTLVVSPELAERGEALAEGRALRVLPVDPGEGDRADATGPAELPVVAADRRALMVYTSGTTGKPKGAVHTHASVEAQVEGLVAAWRWSSDDRTVLVLPLHHVHGIVNVTLCALWSGAACEAPGGFDPVATWERLASGAVTVFMAVPTIYARLVAAWEAASAEDRARWSEGAARLRLMVCGSAALPVSTLEQWRSISGHVLLERYGMTELGMVLSNTLEQRVPGHVGWPLPGVEVRLVGDTGADVAEGDSGELLVRGPQVFREYWRRLQETADSFVDGWFRTGDVAVRDPDGYRLLGRSSVDIIKTGGEKVSALEVEELYREHPAVADLAVVGVADPEWGERVCAAVIVAEGAEADADELRAWGKDRVAVYKVPSRFLFVDALPRNAIGKVTKPDVHRLFTSA